MEMSHSQLCKRGLNSATYTLIPQYTALFEKLSATFAKARSASSADDSALYSVTYCHWKSHWIGSNLKMSGCPQCGVVLTKSVLLHWNGGCWSYVGPAIEMELHQGNLQEVQSRDQRTTLCQ